ncbi:unnamed protein product, partial [Ectocarpus sp. 12 AP-2014]
RESTTHAALSRHQVYRQRIFQDSRCCKKLHDATEERKGGGCPQEGHARATGQQRQGGHRRRAERRQVVVLQHPRQDARACGELPVLHHRPQ